METIVVFRIFKKGNDVIALFPNEINYPDGSCESYMHIGQHSAANYEHCLKITRKATAKEYKSLKQELEQIGYKLKIRVKKGNK